MTVNLHGRLTITVPEAGEVLGIGRDAAYAAAGRGEIPVLRLGRSLRVPTHKLLELLGAPTQNEAGPAHPAEPAPTTSNPGQEIQESTHGSPLRAV
ncbi:MAG: DNA-binding protein [Jatrophihabitans sp.]|nr:DNA-binding protein [Jatrophihabitans sp.]